MGCQPDEYRSDVSLFGTLGEKRPVDLVLRDLFDAQAAPVNDALAASSSQKFWNTSKIRSLL